MALTLRLLGGLTVPEIAAAFLVPETTMAQRITRAKKKIAAANIPYRVPGRRGPARPADRRARRGLPGLQRGLPRHVRRRDPMRVDLTAEAIRLGRVLRSLLPTEPEVAGLLALMLLTEARRTARFAGGELVPLHEQDRGVVGPRADRGGARAGARVPGREPARRTTSSWPPSTPSTPTRPDRRRHRLGPDRRALRPAARRHARRPSSPSTAPSPSPSSTAPRSAWPRSTASTSPTYHAWHATRADLLRRLGRPDDARAAYDAALAATDNAAERAYLTRRRDAL